jgi:hypothetical protein
VCAGSVLHNLLSAALLPDGHWLECDDVHLTSKCVIDSLKREKNPEVQPWGFALFRTAPTADFVNLFASNLNKFEWALGYRQLSQEHHWTKQELK